MKQHKQQSVNFETTYQGRSRNFVLSTQKMIIRAKQLSENCMKMIIRYVGWMIS